MSKELKIEKALDNNLTPIRVGDFTTPIEIATDKLRINEKTTFKKDLVIEGDLFIEGSTADIMMTGGTQIESTNVEGMITIVADSLAVSSVLYNNDSNAAVGVFAGTGYDAQLQLWDASSIKWTIGNDADDNDDLKFDAATATTGGATKLTLEADGDLVTVGDVKITATKGLYFDGGGNTYIYEVSTDTVRHVVGGDVLLLLTEMGTSGNTVHFSSSSAGFTQLEPPFDATDTEVDFRHSNKQKLTLTGNITDIHFQFPNMSGNFLCVLLQDGTGSWDVTNWKTKDSAGNAGAGNSGVVLWA